MTNPRQYSYVGSGSLLELLKQPTHRLCVGSAGDIRQWLVATRQPSAADGTIICTFIIDLDQRLWINDRHSEHVVCAAGAPVLSAGEITFRLARQAVAVVEITNQSTGYCPEPESWDVVAAALDLLQLPRPDSFTTAYRFRRCIQCQTINLIKDDWFVCAVCNASLDREWNFDPPPQG